MNSPEHDDPFYLFEKGSLIPKTIKQLPHEGSYAIGSYVYSAHTKRWYMNARGAGWFNIGSVDVPKELIVTVALL